MEASRLPLGLQEAMPSTLQSHSVELQCQAQFYGTLRPRNVCLGTRACRVERWRRYREERVLHRGKPKLVVNE